MFEFNWREKLDKDDESTPPSGNVTDIESGSDRSQSVLRQEQAMHNKAPARSR